MIHPSKRQRLSLLGGSGDYFTVPKQCPMFPALNPALDLEDSNMFSGQSLVAAYTDSMQVPWLQNQSILLCKSCLLFQPGHGPYLNPKP